MIARNAIQPQYDKVGIKVTIDEMNDMVTGKHVDEGIRSAFLDSTGRFDPRRVTAYMQQLADMPANSEARYRWDQFKRDLQAGRERIKYENLLVKTAYVTEAEAEQDYHNSNDVEEAKYLYVPFVALSDSAINVTDSDLKAYYEKNKKRYKVENTRSMSYVAFPVVPSAEDSLAVRKDLEKVLSDLKIVTEDSVFAASNTQGNNPYARYTIANLPARLSAIRETLTQGQIIGPVLENGNYTIYKVSKIGHDTTYTAKASHILIKWDNDTPEGKKAAKEKARKILADIRGGASFAAKAREFGTDGTSSRGGDLGWVSTGQMVKDFEKPVFDAKKTGLLSDVVETTFGYHIIEVTGVKDNTYYAIATIEQPIAPSDDTLNAALRTADEFASDISGVDEFKEKAKKANVVVFEANDIGASERRINNLGEARQIVAWLFREAKIGKVSGVFDLDDNYVVAIMTDETDKGYKPFEKVKAEITPAVKDEAKGKQIAAKLKGKTEPLEDLAKQFGSDATVNNVSDLKIATPSIPGAGFDPVLFGAMMSVEANKRSNPIIGERGVVVADVQNKTVAPGMGDYAMFKTQLQQAQNNRGGYYVVEALKDAAKIEDNRYKFF